MAEKETALTIDRGFERAAPALVDRFRGLPTGNAADAQGRTGALDCRIKSVSRAASFCGTALTVNAGPGDNLAAWAALEVAQAGDVLVITTAEHHGCSVLGDIYTGMARNKGVSAIVTDGVVRDVKGIDETGIPVFAMGVCPNSPWKNGPGSVGLPIVVGKVTVCSGDIVLGDSDGVVVVPRMRAQDVAEALEAVLEREKTMDAAVKRGDTAPGWLAEALETKGVRYLD